MFPSLSVHISLCIYLSHFAYIKFCRKFRQICKILYISYCFKTTYLKKTSTIMFFLSHIFCWLSVSFFVSTEQLRKPHKTAVHLWEFLLDLLLDGKSDNVICWINREKGEFKLKNQEEVARRWGNLKHRPGMNYDKLSRALRYYYQKGIIKKVISVSS